MNWRALRNSIILGALLANTVLVARFYYSVKRCDWREGVLYRSPQTHQWTCVLPKENEEDERQESEEAPRARA